MWHDLIGPLRHTRFRITRPDRARPPVVSGTHIRVPNAGVSGAVVDQIEFGIVRNPTPYSTAANLPLVWRPAFRALVRSLIFRIKGLETGANARVLVGTGAISSPTYLAGLQIERHQSAANAQLSTADPGEDHVPDHDGSHRGRLPQLDVADLRLPNTLAGIRIDGHGMIVECVVDDFAVSITGAAVHHITAGNAYSPIVGLRMKNPLLRHTWFRDVVGDQVVGERGHYVYRVIHDQRLAFVSVRNAGRHGCGDVEILHIPRVDLVQRTIPRVGVIAGRHRPLARCDGRDQVNARQGSRNRIGATVRLRARSRDSEDRQQKRCGNQGCDTFVLLDPLCPLECPVSARCKGKQQRPAPGQL